ncbi:hypothetical protein J437_LFUL006318 [Ladona fulva]|uniref:Pro-resilin n=1 Tax=Ladona fulva TaxID=123851 RepID=A0A8K0K0U6_LADFU|nr:hypothetical protein J437_LFUL006318 [Ladona fulva]
MGTVTLTEMDTAMAMGIPMVTDMSTVTDIVTVTVTVTDTATVTVTETDTATEMETDMSTAMVMLMVMDTTTEMATDTPMYGPPGFQNGAPIGATEDPLAEPASYQFSYKVEDEEAGLNFGHEEAREGDEATGEYFVLLPDGRTLRVTYVANNDGYQPEITYEEPKNGGNGNGNGSY